MGESYITFSEHLWWSIFSKFKNPVRLLKLRIISSEFEICIEKYFEKNEIWKKICESNIKLWRYQILSKVHPNKLIDIERPLSSDEWKEIFLYYCKWRSSSTFTSLAVNIEYEPEEEITCSTVWRDLLIVGSNSGKIFLFDIEEKHDDVVIGFENNYAIKDVKVWLAEKNLEVIVVLSQNKRLKFFNLTTQGEEPLPTPLKYNATNISVGIDHRLFAENNFRVTEYKFSDDKILFRRTCDLSIFINPTKKTSKFLSMHSENNLLLVMIETNDEIQLFEINFSRDIYEDPELSDIKVITISDISKYENIMVSLIPIKELGLIFCGNKLISCINYPESGKDCKYFELSEFKNGFITCAAMFTNLLLLGWNTGLFSKIYLDSLQDFVNFNNPPHRKSDTFQLCTEPIIAINLAEYLDTSYIIATTKNAQYFMTNYENFEELGSLKSNHSDVELSDADSDDDEPPLKRSRLSQ